ncbi:MAG: alpha/beta fold hydrolase, partial [Anaerolineales bacterium]|nr:alpha/beta fold hydrolase [Anaerolineales bacterium]
MKKFFSFILMLAILSMACNFNLPRLNDNESPAPATPLVEAPRDVLPSIVPKLEELGGVPCEENEDLTCVTVQVPLNQFDSSSAETIDVVFGVLPAGGERYGMFIQAFPGGPGGEGISSAYWDYYDEQILEHYDLVYYDQRGMGLSSELACPVAYAEDFLSYLTSYDEAGLEGADTPEEQTELVEGTKTYVETCVAEMGIDPAKLAFYGTDSVAEDIEDFRALIGDEKFWIYGVSYGTAVAQTYAYAHPDRLAGVILDGTIDMTVSGEQGSLNQEKAFDKVLVAVLNACNEDELCSADMNGKDALKVYDDFAAQVSKDPIEYEFPLADGTKAKGTFTFNALEYTTAYQMYSLTGRMLFLKALAAANNGDLVPMLRLMYDNATVDPATFEYLGDPTFSDTMFLSVLCTDDTFFSGTPEERIEQSIEAGQASNGTVPRLDGSVYTGVSCAFWPSSPKETVQREPLVLEGVPVFVLNAKLDPATPFEDGEAVFKNLDNGYHLYGEGGIHSIFGWGNSCPDDYVTDFLVNGDLPAQREIVCDEWADTIASYVPNPPQTLSEAGDLLDAFIAIDDNLFYMPEFYYSDGSEEKSVGCNLGGSFTFGPSDSNENLLAYTFDKCSLIKGLAMTGTGSFNLDTGLMTFIVDVSGDKTGKLTYTFNYATGEASLSGEYGG